MGNSANAKDYFKYSFMLFLLSLFSFLTIMVLNEHFGLDIYIKLNLSSSELDTSLYAGIHFMICLCLFINSFIVASIQLPAKLLDF